MRVLLMLGRRNLIRRKWRSWLTGMMFFLGTSLLVFTLGLGEGAYGEMINLGTRTFSGDFQVMADGYLEKPSLFKNVRDHQTLVDALRADPRVEAVSSRVEVPGLLSKDNATLGAMVVGVNPAEEVVSIMNTVAQGAWWSTWDDQIPIVVGKGVAARLKAGLGDEITYIGQAADGSIAAELFTVVGIIDSGIDELDRSMAAIPLVAAQELTVLEGRAHRVVGLVYDRADLPALEQGFPLPEGVSLLGWETLAPELAQTIKADRGGLFIFLAILLGVVLIGVANTMLMSVMERTHELGVIQALGTTPREIVGLVLAEIFWLALFGIGAGTLFGMIVNHFLGIYGIPSNMEDFNYGGVSVEVFYTANTLYNNTVYPLMTLAMSMLAGLVPALKAARTWPAEAMRD